LAEAAQWQLISLLFQCPDQDWHSEVARLAEAAGDDQLREAAAASQVEASSELYHTTLGPGGPAAPREVSHRRSVIPGRFIAEVCAFYEAFAYQPQTEEPPDHVAVQTGFIAYLRMKEAYAWMRDERAQAELTREAADCFVRDHLSYVAGRLAACLATPGIQYLERAAAALVERVGDAAIVAAEQRADAAPPPEALGTELTVLSEDGSEWPCAEDSTRL
jgi:nitrate reductase assembly molybdenum cofactor insertion protein NarJ